MKSNLLYLALIFKMLKIAHYYRCCVCICIIQVTNVYIKNKGVSFDARCCYYFIRKHYRCFFLFIKKGFQSNSLFFNLKFKHSVKTHSKPLFSYTFSFFLYIYLFILFSFSLFLLSNTYYN
jgi:hypothetical protein